MKKLRSYKQTLQAVESIGVPVFEKEAKNGNKQALSVLVYYRLNKIESSEIKRSAMVNAFNRYLTKAEKRGRLIREGV